MGAPRLYVSHPGQPGRVFERRWRFEVRIGRDAGAAFEPDRTPALVGAAPAADIRLTDETVSRFHAEVDLEAAPVRVRDLGSKNGLTVEGSRVREARLGPGTAFGVGRTTVEALAEDQPAEPEAPAESPQDLVCVSPSTRWVASWVRTLSPLGIGVSFVGPTGSGRSSWARALHGQSPRKDRPFALWRAREEDEATEVVARAPRGTLLVSEPDRLSKDAQEALLIAIERRAEDAPLVCARSTEPLYGRLVPGLLGRLGAVHLPLDALERRTEDRRAFFEAQIEHLGLPKLGPALELCLEGVARVLGFSELKAVVVSPWPPPEETPAHAELRRALLCDLLDRLEGDIDRAAQVLGRRPTELFEELSHREVPLEE